MLWYNSPETIKAIHEGRYSSLIREGNRLMRLIRTERRDTHR